MNNYFFQRVYDITFIAMLICFSVGLILLDEKSYKKDWKSILITVLKIVCLFGVFTLCGYLVFFIPAVSDEPNIGPNILSLSYLLVTILYFSVFLREKNVLIFFVKLFLTMAAILVVSKINQNLGKSVGFLTNENGWIYFARILPYPIIIFTGLFVHRFNISRFVSVSRNFSILSILISCLIISSTFLQDYILYFYYDAPIFNFFLFLFLALFVVLMYSYYSFYQLNLVSDKNVELQAQATLTSSEKMMVTLSEKNKNDIRSIKHDLKNHIAYMNVLLKEGKYDELRAYFDKMSEMDSPVFKFVDCGNNVISAILNLESSKADLNNVKINYNVVVPPLLPFNDVDLSSIITNIIDNAIEACIKDKAINPEINFGVALYRNYLRITCSNPTSLKHLSTTTDKKDPGHGYGTRIIENIAEKYNGIVEFKVEDSLFKVSAMLEVNESNKEGSHA